MAVRDPLGPAVYGDHLTLASSTGPSTGLGAIAELIGHRFRQPGLLREALTHRSAVPGAGSNERLEFVGDRVLGLLIAEWLAERFPNEQEGALGRRLAALVAQPTLVSVARTEHLADALEHGVVVEQVHGDSLLSPGGRARREHAAEPLVAVERLEGTRVAHELLDGIIVDEPVAAEDLDGVDRRACHAVARDHARATRGIARG